MSIVSSVDQIEIKRTEFKELQEFRKLLKTEGICHKKQPFTAKKTVVNGYKAFFAFLSLIHSEIFGCHIFWLPYH